MTEVLAPRRNLTGGKDGYTLVEVLIVLAIIALLVALVGPRLVGVYDKAKVTATTAELATLKQGLVTMQAEIGRYPTEQEGLSLLLQAPGQGVTGWSGPYLQNATAIPKDKWDHPYVYVPPSAEGGEPQVISLGADGKPGGTGLAADIVK